MKKKLAYFFLVLASAALASISLQGCAKGDDGASNTSAAEEDQFTLTGEAI